MGFRDYRLSQNSPTLWGQTPKRMNFRRRTFWHAEKGPRFSWGWQSLLMGREAIYSSITWLVGTRANINILEDRWLS